MAGLRLLGTLVARRIHGAGHLYQNVYKLGFAIDDQVTLKHVTNVYADHVMELIKSEEPNVTFFKQQEGESMQDALSRFDSLKVPFVVCLDENLSTRATVGLRMQDTRLCEEVHASHLASKVILYLKHMPPSLKDSQ